MTRLALSHFSDEALLLSTQDASTLPFSIRRVFVIRDVKKLTVRGRHAHKKTKQAIFCIQGSVKIRLDNGRRKKIYTLTTPHKGVFIDRLTWSEMYDFSKDAILMVFASHYFKPSDYIRDYDTFLKEAKR